MPCYDWAAYRKAKGSVNLHLNPDGDNLMLCDAYLSTGKVHAVHGMARLCDESGVISVLDCGYVDYKSLYSIDLQGSVLVTRIQNNLHEKKGVISSDVLIRLTGE